MEPLGQSAGIGQRQRSQAGQRTHAIEGYAKAELKRAHDRLSEPVLTALTIVLLCLMFLVAPLHAAGILESQAYGLVLELALIGGVLILSGSSAAVAMMLAAVGLAVGAAVLRLHHRSVLDMYLDAASWLIIAVTLTVVVAHAVFGPGRVTYHRVIGAVLVYLTMGLTFVALFTFVALRAPDAFLGLAIADSPALVSDLIYFSFVTLTTTGYGHVVPVHPVARALANVEAIIGQLYPATLLARLVTLELEGRRK